MEPPWRGTERPPASLHPPNSPVTRFMNTHRIVVSLSLDLLHRVEDNLCRDVYRASPAAPKPWLQGMITIQGIPQIPRRKTRTKVAPGQPDGVVAANYPAFSVCTDQFPSLSRKIAVRGHHGQRPGFDLLTCIHRVLLRGSGAEQGMTQRWQRMRRIYSGIRGLSNQSGRLLTRGRDPVRARQVGRGRDAEV
jgi:hypothetical protein